MNKNHGLLATLLAIMLVAAMMLTLSACNQSETNGTTAPDQGTEAPTTSTEDDGTLKIKGDMLSWDLINSVPVKTANMDITAARKICVDFFRISKNALWISDSKYEAKKDDKVVRSMEADTIYGGLPYITRSNGNIYRLMDYINPQTGVVDVQAAGKVQELFGNQCSAASYWGWARVINSAKFDWTQLMIHKNGFLRVGPYSYDDTVDSFSDDFRTREILKEHGNQTMYQAYAQLKAGDGLLYYTTAGHAAMVATDAHVEYKADGTIDPSKSYVYIIDQAGEWITDTNEAGDTYIYSSNTDAKWTFITMFNKQYIPFSYAEFLGTDPIEETEVSFSHTGDTITMAQIRAGKITCNYNLSDAYAIVKDAQGNEVYKLAVRPEHLNIKELVFGDENEVDDPDDGIDPKDYRVEWGTVESLNNTKEYTVEIVVQIATGERPTLWTGKLAW